jgi:CheY-like chemotaxis protein
MTQNSKLYKSISNMVNLIAVTIYGDYYKAYYILIYFFYKAEDEVRILIAEDETDVLKLYKGALERRGHKVVLARDGEEGLKAYEDSLRQEYSKIGTRYISNFDVVVLDYKMPKKDGMEVAKSILKVTPRQRIIFASAFVKDTLMESVKKLDQVVELIQKPFELKALVDTIEDTEVYARLQQFNVNIEKIRGLNLSHEELVELMEHVDEIMKQKFLS